MIRPIEPKQEDCCSSGCIPCIFDVYEKQLKLYESLTENGETKSYHELCENAISQLEYTEFFVVDNIDLGSQHKLILFRKSKPSNFRVIWNPGDHFLIKYNDMSRELRMSKAYTPIKINVIGKGEYDFAILVKVYSDGIVSNYLNCLTKDDVTLWRGPYGHYKLIPNSNSRLIMITQGTGIAPFYSIIKQILNNEEDMTKIVLLYCCKNLQTVLLRDELYLFKSYWNFHYEVYVSDKLQGPCKYQEPIFNKKCEHSCISKFKLFSESDKFLLCGSNKFMNHFKQLLLKENVPEHCIVKL